MPSLRRSALAACLLGLTALLLFFATRNGDGPTPSLPGDAHPVPSPADARPASPTPNALRTTPQSGLPVAGVQVVADGHPVAGAILCVSPAPPTPRFWVAAESTFVRTHRVPTTWWTPTVGTTGTVLGTTDADGTVVLASLRGPCAVHARDGDRASRMLVLGPDAGLPDVVQFELVAMRAPVVDVVAASTSEPLPADVRAYAEVAPGDPSPLYLALGPPIDLTNEPPRTAHLLLDSLAERTALSVRASRSGHASGALDTAVDTAAHWTIRLSQEPSIDGRVVDEKGHALADVDVVARATDFGFGRAPRDRTDAAGRFRVESPRAEYTLTARCPGYASGTVAAVAGGSTDVTIVLEALPTTVVRGRIVAADDTPAAGLRVELWPTDRDGTDALRDQLRQGRVAFATATGPRGEFVFDAVTPGAFVLDAVLPASTTHPDDTTIVRLRQSDLAAFVVAPDQPVDWLDLRLPATGQVRVRVAADALATIGASLRPHELPTLHLKRVLVERRDVQPLTQAELVASRATVFADLLPGDYVLTTSPASFVRHVVVRADEHIDVDEGAIATPPRGVIVRDGLPVAHCAITAIAATGGDALAFARSADDGSFILTGAHAGEWILHVRDREGRAAFCRVGFGDGTPTRTEWPTATLTVGWSTAPPAAARLRVVAERIADLDLATLAPAGLGTVAEVPLSAADDAASVSGLGAGRYRVTLVDAAGVSLRTTTIDVADAANARVLL